VPMPTLNPKDEVKIHIRIDFDRFKV
jgi:hypothetical protein